MRQIGDRIYWYGERSATSPSWSNVAEGFIKGSDMELGWADVPKGGILGYGHLRIKVVSNTYFYRVSKTGSGFGGTYWWK